METIDLVTIEDEKKLEEILNNLPKESRGRVAELVGNVRYEKFKEIVTEMQIRSEEPDDEKMSSEEQTHKIFRELKANITGIKKMVLNPSCEVCYKIALKNYKDRGDLFGVQRIGDLFFGSGNFKEAISIYRFLGDFTSPWDSRDTDRKAFIGYMLDLKRREEQLKKSEHAYESSSRITSGKL